MKAGILSSKLLHRVSEPVLVAVSKFAIKRTHVDEGEVGGNKGVVVGKVQVCGVVGRLPPQQPILWDRLLRELCAIPWLHLRSLALFDHMSHADISSTHALKH